MKACELIGNKYGKLTVVRKSSRKNTKLLWSCLCECGKIIDVPTCNLKSGHTQSCGCGKNIGNYRHGLRHHELYNTWKAMLSRCNNKNNISYTNYGGRGIKVCKEWMCNPIEFISWAEKNGWKYGLTIERIDNNAGYSPENCRWATRSEQARNTTRNRNIEVDGIIVCAKDYSKIIGKSRSTVLYHLNKGTIQEAL